MREMDYRIRGWPLSTVAGFAVILLYCTFTGISWLLYPYEFGPLTHYLSRLGDLDYSPVGAFFYNAGCILTGIALLLFFLGLYQWHAPSPAQRAILVLGQVIGFAAAFALMMIGVFSEDQGPPHMLASSVFFLLNFIVLLLINLALLIHPSFGKPIPILGILLDLSTLWMGFSVGGPITEWYTVFGSLFYVALVSIRSMRGSTPSRGTTE